MSFPRTEGANIRIQFDHDVSQGASKTRRGVLGRGLVWFVPVFMIIQALMYGGLVPSQQAGTFPIIGLGGFRVRLEDILIIAGFAIWVATLFMAKSIRMNTQQGRSTRNRITPVMMLTVWTGLGLVQAAIRGVQAGNVNSLLETRTLAVPLLYFVLVMFWVPAIRLTFLARVLRTALFPLVVVLTLGVFLPIDEVMAQLLTIVNGAYGGYATPLESMVVFFYCLVWARILFTKRISFRDVLLVLFVVAGMVARISKTNWVYIMEVPLFLWIIAGRSRLFLRRRSTVRRRWLLVVIIAVVLLISAITFLSFFLPETLDSYTTAVIYRITRPDAGGDISGGRLELISAGLVKLAEAPIFGIGMGYWYEHYFLGTLLYEVPDHFSPLWVTIRAGFFMFIPVLILTFWYIWKGFRVCKLVLDSELQGFVTACYVYTLTMIIYSLYGVPQNLFEPQILFWLSVAVVLNAAHHFENRAPAQSLSLAS